MCDVYTDCPAVPQDSVVSECTDIDGAAALTAGTKRAAKRSHKRGEGDANKSPGQRIDFGSRGETNWVFAARTRTTPSRRIDIVCASTRHIEPDIDLIAQAVLANTADFARIARGEHLSDGADDVY